MPNTKRKKSLPVQLIIPSPTKPILQIQVVPLHMALGWHAVEQVAK